MLVLLALYLLLTSALYFLQPQTVKSDSLRFFFQDPNIQGRLRDEIAYDHDGSTVLITRVFHNKVNESAQVFFVNLYRSADLSYLFTLSDMSTMYDNRGRIPIMLPIELPFFLLASWHLIRHWQNYRKRYTFLIPMLLGSLLICGLFYPAVNPVKTFPLVLTIRIIIFLGMYEFITHSRWVKKLHLSS